MVQLKTKLDAVGGKQVNRPQKEWVRVENTHEPIITYPQYIRAVSSLKQQKAKESKNFKNIYYCGCCGRALFNAHYGTVFCKQRSFKTDSDCRDIEIKKHDADREKLEQELAALRQAQEEEEIEQEGSQRKADQAMAFLEEEELTEDMKEKLIEKVIVYLENRIEIVWKFEGHLKIK